MEHQQCGQPSSRGAPTPAPCSGLLRGRECPPGQWAAPPAALVGQPPRQGHCPLHIHRAPERSRASGGAPVAAAPSLDVLGLGRGGAGGHRTSQTHGLRLGLHEAWRVLWLLRSGSAGVAGERAESPNRAFISGDGLAATVRATFNVDGQSGGHGNPRAPANLPGEPGTPPAARLAPGRSVGPRRAAAGSRGDSRDKADLQSHLAPAINALETPLGIPAGLQRPTSSARDSGGRDTHVTCSGSSPTQGCWRGDAREPPDPVCSSGRQVAPCPTPTCRPPCPSSTHHRPPPQVASAEPVGDSQLGAGSSVGTVGSHPGLAGQCEEGLGGLRGYCGRHGRVQGPPGRRARLRARSQVGRAGRMRPGAPALRAELRAETQAAAFRFLPEDQLSVSRSPTRGQPWRSLAEGRGLRGVLKPGSAGRRTAP